MIIKSLRLTNFRNIANFAGEMHDGFNVIQGNNGQGKTNFLEAIHWLGHLRPLRTTRVRELVRWHEKSTIVEGLIDQDGIDHRLKVTAENGTRKAFLEDKKTTTLQYSGRLSVVLFTPADLDLIKGPPETRRRFIDRSIFNLNQSFLTNFLHYRQALESRNECLRSNMPDALIEAYEISMAKYGIELMKIRHRQTAALKPFFEQTFRQITGFEGNLDLGYRSIWNSLPEPTVDCLADTLRVSRTSDRQRGFTQRGPHTDDLVFKLSEHSAKNFASQGQQRALVLSMKIAEILYFKQQNKEWPVLLLDDVSSELDPSKNQKLFQFLNDFSGQVFITTTDEKVLRIDHNYQLWCVEEGVMSSRERL